MSTLTGFIFLNFKTKIIIKLKLPNSDWSLFQWGKI